MTVFSISFLLLIKSWTFWYIVCLLMSLYKKVMHFKKWSGFFWPTLYLSTTSFCMVFDLPPSQNILLSHNQLTPFFKDDHITSGYYTVIQWFHPLIWVLPVSNCQLNVQTNCKLVGISAIHSQWLSSRQGDRRTYILDLYLIRIF